MEGLRKNLADRRLSFWTYGGAEINDSDVRYFRHRRLGMIPLLFREGYRTRIVDSSHYLVEHPNPLLVPLWVILRLILRFAWVKVLHDGSLPARHARFGPVRRLLFRLAVASVDEFAAANDELSRWLRDTVGVTVPITTANELLPLAADAADTTPPEDAEKVFSRHGKWVCSIGVFLPEYGFDRVADAVAKIRRESGRDIGLLLLDGAFERDQSYRTAVLRDRDWIHLLERVPHPAVLHILKRCDLFVRATKFEACGLSRIESLLSGTPVVATNAGETRGMATFEFGDQERLIELIRNGIENPNLEETRVWADRYRAEAEENLRRWSKLILPDGASG